jgi:two-component system NarL family sensor kinase
MGQEDLIITIAAATLALFLLSTGFILFFIFFSRSKRLAMEREKEREISYIKELSGVKSEVQEQTLLNVARELHDNLGQMLTVTKMKTDGLSQEKFQEGQSEIASLLDEMIGEVKFYSRTLNSDRLKNQGLYMSMSNELERISRMGVIHVQNELEATLKLDDPDHEVIVFRIFQEFLNNALKHSEGDKYHFQSSTKANELLITMRDNGVGFDLAETAKTSSGLLNIKSRASLVGGAVQIQSTPEEGTSIELRIPIFT